MNPTLATFLRRPAPLFHFYDQTYTMDLEGDVFLRGEEHYYEASNVYAIEETDPEEGYTYPVSHLVTYRILGWDDLRQEYRHDITGTLTDAEHRLLQSTIYDHWCDLGGSDGNA